MAVFQALDPELHLKLIEGYQDELKTENRTQELLYKTKSRCKRCGCVMHKEFDGRRTFTEESLLPRALLRCPNCGFLLEPFTDLVIESGSPAKIPFELPIGSLKR
jgi:hypothetical protein